jgi:hypothetical protein
MARRGREGPDCWYDESETRILLHPRAFEPLECRVAVAFPSVDLDDLIGGALGHRDQRIEGLSKLALIRP